MEEYTVGSVADLISQNKVPRVKESKKKKSISKNENNEVVEETPTKRSAGGKKKSNKNKEKQINTAVDIEIPTGIENRNADTKINTKSKKRKKKNEETNNMGTEVEDVVPKAKKKKESILDLDHVPSDSDEDEAERLQQNPKKPQKKKMDYKDFVDHTVFVGNIPINYDKQKICKVFSRFGKILSARIRCVPIAEINMSKKVAAVKKQFNPNRNSLVAYVKYESQDSANSALKANGMVVDGHHLRIDLAEGTKEKDNNKAVFVGGLPFDTEDDELWEFFQNCGKINSVRVIRDSQTSMGKGFGYVNFDSSASVEIALQLDGQQLKKRNINVKRCIKARNKNKLNAFGRKKSKEMADELLCKKGKKFKMEKKKKSRTEAKTLPSSFQGNKANVKKKKKKKLSKAALHKRKIVKILGTGSKSKKGT